MEQGVEPLPDTTSEVTEQPEADSAPQPWSGLSGRRT